MEFLERQQQYEDVKERKLREKKGSVGLLVKPEAQDAKDPPLTPQKAAETAESFLSRLEISNALREKRRKALRDEICAKEGVFSPVITARAKKIARQGTVYDRLHREKDELLKRRENRTEAHYSQVPPSPVLSPGSMKALSTKERLSLKNKLATEPTVGDALYLEALERRKRKEMAVSVLEAAERLERDGRKISSRSVNLVRSRIRKHLVSVYSSWLPKDASVLPVKDFFERLVSSASSSSVIETHRDELTLIFDPSESGNVPCDNFLKPFLQALQAEEQRRSKMQSSLLQKAQSPPVSPPTGEEGAEEEAERSPPLQAVLLKLAQALVQVSEKTRSPAGRGPSAGERPKKRRVSIEKVVSFAKRSEAKKRSHEARLERIRVENEEKKVSACTFRPAINKRTPSNIVETARDEPVYDRLYRLAQNLAKKRADNPPPPREPTGDELLMRSTTPPPVPGRQYPRLNLDRSGGESAEGRSNAAVCSTDESVPPPAPPPRAKPVPSAVKKRMAVAHQKRAKAAMQKAVSRLRNGVEKREERWLNEKRCSFRSGEALKPPKSGPTSPPLSKPSDSGAVEPKKPKRRKQPAKTTKRKPSLIMKVDIAPGKVGSINIFWGDEPSEVARNFGKVYGLKGPLVKQLTSLIVSHMLAANIPTADELVEVSQLAVSAVDEFSPESFDWEEVDDDEEVEGEDPTLTEFR